LLPVRLKNTPPTRSISASARSSASIVLPKVAGASLSAIASIAARDWLKASSKASAKCESPILSNGGMENGVSHVSRNGFESVMRRPLGLVFG
jgi:hypothetical protein